MTLDEQIIACARANGYGREEVLSKPVRRDMTNGHEGEWRIYFTTISGTYAWIVTDKQLKQWQRDNKLNLIGVNE